MPRYWGGNLELISFLSGSQIMGIPRVDKNPCLMNSGLINMTRGEEECCSARQLTTGCEVTQEDQNSPWWFVSFHLLKSSSNTSHICMESMISWDSLFLGTQSWMRVLCWSTSWLFRLHAWPWPPAWVILGFQLLRFPTSSPRPSTTAWVPHGPNPEWISFLQRLQNSLWNFYMPNSSAGAWSRISMGPTPKKEPSGPQFWWGPK